MARPQAADGERSPVCWVAANVLNKKPRTSDKRWSSSMGLGEMLTSPHRIMLHTKTGASDLD